MCWSFGRHRYCESGEWVIRPEVIDDMIKYHGQQYDKNLVKQAWKDYLSYISTLAVQFPEFFSDENIKQFMFKLTCHGNHTHMKQP